LDGSTFKAIELTDCVVAMFPPIDTLFVVTFTNDVVIGALTFNEPVELALNETGLLVVVVVGFVVAFDVSIFVGINYFSVPVGVFNIIYILI